MINTRAWFERTFGLPKEGCHFPVSFRVNGLDSASFLSRWKFDKSGRPGMETVTLEDPDSGLECRCEVKLFENFFAIEFIGFLKNNSDKPTYILSDIRALDTIFPVEDGNTLLVHHARGSDSLINDFEPLEYLLGYNESHEMWSLTGRSSDGSSGGSLPFFNLQNGHKGVIGAIGWSGSWRVLFHRYGRGEKRVRVCAGMNRAHLRLLPGEEIRTPRILLLFWEGDCLDAQNTFRRLILTHYRPSVASGPVEVPICNAVWGESWYESQIRKAAWWKRNNIPIDAFWIDAGWYGDAPFREDATLFNSQWASQVGNWWPNKAYYPNGLGPVSDALRDLGLGFVLWIEPERVFHGTQLAYEHPEWLLGPVGDNYLFNLGLPEAREYLTNLVSSIILEAGVTCYRQDFNISPAPFWEAADTPDRVGMAEIRYIKGLYAFWDELLARHPNLYIDNCSSGGRRIDLETISRSIPLWRSDFQCSPGFNPTADPDPWFGCMGPSQCRLL